MAGSAKSVPVPFNQNIMRAVFDPFRSASACTQVLAQNYATSSQLDAVRDQRLARLIETCVRHSPFYRQRLRGVDPERARLSDLPVVHRHDLMHRFDTWVTERRLRIDALLEFVADPGRMADPYLGDYVVWQSSGTSGMPGVFMQDAQAMAVYDALDWARGPYTQWAASPQGAAAMWGNLAFVGATNGHFASTVSIERLRRLNPLLATRLHSLSFLQPLADLSRQLDRLQPAALATYPSVALQLAQAQQAGRLNIAPQQIWLGGETLAEPLRELIAQAFGGTVRNSYGASEFLSMAFECPLGALHVNADWVILEPVDDRGRPVPPGTPGTSVLLTNLANHVQPLLRYALPDRVTIQPGRCACGSALPVIAVHGRQDDVLQLPGRAGGSVSVLPMALTTVLEDEAGLFDFQVLQTEPAGLTLRTRKRGEPAAAQLRRASRVLSAFLGGLGAARVRIHTQTGARIPRDASGKIRQVVSLHASGSDSEMQG